MSEIIIGNDMDNIEVKEKKEELATPLKGKVVNCKLLNVRKRPKRDAEILRVIAKDDEVEILNTAGEFLRVKLSDGTYGFCMSTYIG